MTYARCDQHQHVTVLIARVKSMDLLADRDPEESCKILDGVVTEMIEAVHCYESTEDTVLGDGIMAVFGATLADTDHAVRAGYAALRMQESVQRYAKQVHRSYGVNVQIGVGLNSGEVVIRRGMVQFMMPDETTSVAGLMEQLANPGSVLLTSSTLHQLGGLFAVKALGPCRPPTP